MGQTAGHWVTAIAALVAALAAVPAVAAEPVTGSWITEEKDAIITIAPCGQKLCGKITRFLVTPPDGLEQRDINNKNPKLRQRKLLGLPVLTSFTEDGNEWRGQIYDPNSGKTYRSLIERRNASTLSVKGCIGPFCQTQLWKRAR